MGLLTPPKARELAAVARATGFPPAAVEKTARLPALVDDLAAHPYLGERVSLFGGTALTLTGTRVLDPYRTPYLESCQYRNENRNNANPRTKKPLDKEHPILMDLEQCVGNVSTNFCLTSFILSIHQGFRDSHRGTSPGLAD